MSAIRIGDDARAETTLRPGGMVSVHGRRHSAISQSGYVEAGVSLVVTGGDNQGLAVRPVTEIVDRPGLPNYGKIVYSNYGDRIRADHRQDALADQRLRQLRRAGLQRQGLVIGFVAAVTAAWLGIGSPERWTATENFRSLLAHLVAFPVAGCLVLPWIHDTLEDLDSTFARFTKPVGFLALVGFGAIFGWLIPEHDVLTAVLGATIGAAMLGVPIPAVLMLVGAAESEGAEPAEAGEVSENSHS